MAVSPGLHDVGLVSALVRCDQIDQFTVLLRGSVYDRMIGPQHGS